jgi:hypothetical protein
MAKKTFASGLDRLLEPTTKDKTTSLQSPSSPKSPESPPLQDPGEPVSILIRIPVDLKIKLDTHCAQNRITKQNFITNLINKAINY